MPIPADHLPPDLHLDSAGRVDEDIPCDRCAYDLRTLSPDAACPECGHPVLQSLRAHGERIANPRWLDHLACGAICCAFGLVLLLLTAFGVFALFHFDLEGPLGLLAIDGAAGAWLCTTAPAPKQRIRLNQLSRLAGRWLVILWSAAMLYATLLDGFRSLALLVLCQWSLLLGSTLILIHLATSTRRLGWRGLSIAFIALAAFLSILAILFAITLCVDQGYFGPMNDRPWWFTLYGGICAWASVALCVAIHLTIQCTRKARAMRRPPEAKPNTN